MYSASASKFASASSRHLSCTAGPAFQGLLDLFFAGKFSAIGGGNGLLDFGDLPFVDGDKFLDRLGGDERAAPVHRFRQTVKLVLEFDIQAESENRRFSHNVHIIHQLYTLEDLDGSALM